jgi:hypothetical protein
VVELAVNSPKLFIQYGTRHPPSRGIYVGAAKASHFRRSGPAKRHLAVRPTGNGQNADRTRSRAAVRLPRVCDQRPRGHFKVLR